MGKEETVLHVYSDNQYRMHSNFDCDSMFDQEPEFDFLVMTGVHARSE